MKFKISLNSKIYVDKSELIGFLNDTLNTGQRYVCVSRPGRFGKSMAVDMLAAYYGCGEDTDSLFKTLMIYRDVTYQKHLNQYHVLQINMQDFLSKFGDVNGMLGYLQNRLVKELGNAYPDLTFEEDFIDSVMYEVFVKTGRQFVILIDEWDCLFRVFKDDTVSQKKYLDFLRMWLKDRSI